MAYRLSQNFADKIMGFVRYSHIKTTLEVVESSFMSFLTYATTLSACRLCHRTACGERWMRQVWQKLNNLKCLLTTSCSFKSRQTCLKLRLKIDREDRRGEERWGETCQSKALYLQKAKKERGVNVYAFTTSRLVPSLWKIQNLRTQTGERGGAVDWGAALQAGKSRVRIPLWTSWSGPNERCIRGATVESVWQTISLLYTRRGKYTWGVTVGQGWATWTNAFRGVAREQMKTSGILST